MAELIIAFDMFVFQYSRFVQLVRLSRNTFTVVSGVHMVNHNVPMYTILLITFQLRSYVAKNSAFLYPFLGTLKYVYKFLAISFF